MNAGEESGLESDRSDYVASLGVGVQGNLLLNLQGRFDEDDLAVRRGETSLDLHPSGTHGHRQLHLYRRAAGLWLSHRPSTGRASAHPQSLPTTGTIFGGAQYDIDNSIFVSDSIGLRYTKPATCFTLSVADFNETRDFEGDANRSISFRVALRTLGEFGAAVRCKPTLLAVQITRPFSTLQTGTC